MQQDVRLPPDPGTRISVWLRIAMFGAVLRSSRIAGYVTSGITPGAIYLTSAIAGAVLVFLAFPKEAAPDTPPADTKLQFQLLLPGLVAVLFGVLRARSQAKGRVVIAAFADLRSEAGQERSQLAELLRVELARLSDLFQVVGDQRAVASVIGPKRALDATLSVDDLASAIQAAVTAESAIRFGPIAVPARLMVALADRFVRAPRISGTLHCDDGRIILTAEQAGPSRLSWRVPPHAPRAHEASTPAGDPDPTGLGLRISHASRTVDGAEGSDGPEVAALVRELALRIFTDLALGRSVRWEASEHFVKGIDFVRACLRSPRDRKVNLRHAERNFLLALSEDEDFPHAYYNLGVVYNELYRLAWKAGRRHEAKNHLRAAETSFSRAVQREPHRWEPYFALAQARYKRGRFDVVVDLTERVLDLRPTRADRAKVLELQASALFELSLQERASGILDDDTHTDDRLARDLAARGAHVARRSVRLATFAVARSRLLPRIAPVDDELAAACLQTLGKYYARSTPADGPRAEWRCYGCVRMIYREARQLTERDAELRLELGLLALGRLKYRRAIREFDGAMRADPNRPIILAASALALIHRNLHDCRQPGANFDPATAVLRAYQATGSMMRSYSPARDAAACELATRTLIGLAFLNAMREDAEPDDDFDGVADPSSAAAALEAQRSFVAALLKQHDLAPLDLENARPAVLHRLNHSREIWIARIRAAERLSSASRDEAAQRRAARRRGSAAQHDPSTEAETHTPSVSAAFFEAISGTPLGEDVSGAFGNAMREAIKNLAKLRELRQASGASRGQISEAAVRAAESVTSVNPLSVTAWVVLGDVHQELGDFDNAWRAWNNALTQDPDNAALYERLGTAWWHLAFDGRSSPEDEKLRNAAIYFDKALLLYESGALIDQTRTRYRLAKLSSALCRFDEARAHLRVVEATLPAPPVVGWTLLGLAYLRQRDYAECEYFFGRVVQVGDELAEKHAPGSTPVAERVVGHPVDERLWPLAYVRAWGRLGLAFALSERDGDLAQAERLVREAMALRGEVRDNVRFPTRLAAACADCSGLIELRRGHHSVAVARLRGAVHLFPYSRTYINLCQGLIGLVDQTPAPHNWRSLLQEAARALDHAEHLGSESADGDEIELLRERMSSFAA